MEARSPAARSTGKDVRVVKEAVEHRGDGRGVAEELAPVLHGTVRREQRGGPLVAPHHDLEEILGRRVRELAHAEVVDDEQRDGRDVGEIVLPRTGELRLDEVLDEGMRLAIEDAMALLDHGEADRLGQVALAGARRTKEEAIGVRRDYAPRPVSSLPVCNGIESSPAGILPQLGG